jgi:hypothetical protein
MCSWLGVFPYPIGAVWYMAPRDSPRSRRAWNKGNSRRPSGSLRLSPQSVSATDQKREPSWHSKWRGKSQMSGRQAGSGVNDVLAI